VHQFSRTGLSLCVLLALAACSSPPPPAAVAVPAPVSGERLVYVVGCVNCHHQTPKEIINAPPLLVTKGYSLPAFRTLLRTGVAQGGRDLYAQGSIMGIVAREQLKFLTDDEVEAIHHYLQTGWTAERAAAEEAKIATLPPPTWMNQ
jgi:mono/diheme cytochrome c family protein